MLLFFFLFLFLFSFFLLLFLLLPLLPLLRLLPLPHPHCLLRLLLPTSSSFFSSLLLQRNLEFPFPCWLPFSYFSGIQLSFELLVIISLPLFFLFFLLLFLLISLLLLLQRNLEHEFAFPRCLPFSHCSCMQFFSSYWLLFFFFLLFFLLIFLLISFLLLFHINLEGQFAFSRWFSFFYFSSVQFFFSYCLLVLFLSYFCFLLLFLLISLFLLLQKNVEHEFALPRSLPFSHCRCMQFFFELLVSVFLLFFLFFFYFFFREMSNMNLLFCVGSISLTAQASNFFSSYWLVFLFFFFFFLLLVLPFLLISPLLLLQINLKHEFAFPRWLPFSHCSCTHFFWSF